jgi:Ca2+-transporting ATPase
MNSHHPIWAIAAEDVYNNLTTAVGGLNDAEADLRIKQYGYNELPKPQTRPLILRFVDQLTHFMALLLWVAGILAFVSQTPELGWAIWAVIWINAIFSFSQEFQAEKALAALKQVLPSQVKVFRNGELCLLPARELVTGDVIQLEEGDKISADARLVESQYFYVDVSILTGESLPASRSPEPVAENIRASDAPNLVFAGSTVAAGRGVAVVYATGSHTEFGQVARLTANVKREPSTLEVQISKVVHVITMIAIGMGVLVFLLTKLLVGMGLKESFIFAIGIIVAFVPEGLLPTVSLALAIGVKRMAKRNALQPDGQEELTEAQRGEIEDANDELASLGYRVLGVATHQGGEELRKQDNESLEQNLTFIGLVAMIDPAPPEVSRAIALCHRAGIQVTMITGDYGLTARAIALYTE